MADRQLRTRITRALGGGIVAVAVIGGTAFAADASVAITGFAFSPGSVTVNVGDSVTWTNSDGQAHTATANDASFDTGSIADGASASATFSTAGTFAYHCSIHPTMTGTVVVEAAAEPTPAPTAAPTNAPGAGATTPPTDTVATDPADRDGSGFAPAAIALIGIGLVALGIARRRIARA